MSMAITALLLLRLQAWRGQWLEVPALASHLAVSQDAVRSHLRQLAAEGHVALWLNTGGEIYAACIDPQEGQRTGEQHPTPQPGPLERAGTPVAAFTPDSEHQPTPTHAA